VIVSREMEPTNHGMVDRTLRLWHSWFSDGTRLSTKNHSDEHLLAIHYGGS
jgi:hypothetical protein